MLPLIRTRDSIAIVCTTDPSVKARASQRESPDWVVASEIRHTKDALVLTVRPLSSSEILRCQGFLGDTNGQAELTVHAAKQGTIKAAGPGIDATDADAVDDLLERLQPAELASLGSFVLNQSLATEDPTTTAD